MDLLPFDTVAAAVAAVSALGIILLTPLYLSQRRDVRRLHEWMEREPGHAAADLARSEARLDKAELELERIYAERGEPVPGTAEHPVAATEAYPEGVGPEAAAPGLAAARVTGERPALERITMERAALDPHPRWHHFARRALQPRALALLALAALALGVAAVITSENLLEGGENGATGPVDPGGIEVAVLNGTTISGLAGEVSRKIEQSGFLPGDVTNYEAGAQRTIVMHQPGQKRAATRVARELGGDPAIQEIDRSAERASGGADVVVIVGEDLAARG